MYVRLCYSLLLLLLLRQGDGGQKTEPLADGGERGAFWGSDHYDFTITLPGSGLQCFWHYAQESGRFYLTYMVQKLSGLASDRRLSVRVLTPRGFLETFSNDAVGQINFQTQETGFYQMCLTNAHNSFGSMQVFLNFGVYYRGAGDMTKREDGRGNITDTLSQIESSSKKLQGNIWQMWRHYNFGRMTKGADYYLLLSNASYVTWWSATQSAVIITAGYLQLLILKRLVNPRSTESIKPRC
ncbi:transmembrane emp24 domain-containing protein 6-like [Brienomyrus brachyistius]|uniref:transmembrane emp24 domain-containing protein 6-like n=1 Tax=Brienomyrus brachyistius TaxID=42636 RepID=UPI0020B2F5BE|nr:transmembrane emp24 domain-containing protein 6-like [Brienomyrus brachyistius]